MQLRPYQEEAIEQLRECFRNDLKRVILSLPTGAGKTIAFAKIVHDVYVNGGTPMVLVHRKELMQQAYEKLKVLGVSPALISAGKHISSAGSYIASVQTLRRRELPKITLLIVDECHLADFKPIIEEYIKQDIFIIGVTATPVSTRKHNLSELYQQLIVATDVPTLIEEGSLLPAQFYGAKEDITDLVVDSSGEFSDKSQFAHFNKSGLYDGVVDNYLKLAKGTKTLVFNVNVQHSITMTERFVASGISSAHLDGTAHPAERKRILDRFRNGNIEVLNSVAILTAGFDCLDENTEILTPQGWVSHTNIDNYKECYSLNTTTNLIEIANIDRIIKKDVVDEEMVHIRSQRFNTMTTKGHKFYYKKSRGYVKSVNLGLSDFKVCDAIDIYNKVNNTLFLPLSGITSADLDCDLTDDEVRFLAWCVTDSTISYKSLTIHQSIVKYADRIQRILDEIGIHYTMRFRTVYSEFNTEGCDTVDFNIPRGTGNRGRSLTGFVKYQSYLNKDLPVNVYSKLSIRQFKIFYHELVLANGTDVSHKNKTGTVWHPNKKFIDNLQHLAVIRGFATTHASEISKYGTICYRVSCREKQTIRINCRHFEKTNSTLVKYTGVVWCITNKNNTIITRRGGKVIIMGNCPSIETIILNRATKSLALFLQVCGRGSRPYPGKTHFKVIDMGSNCWRLGFYDDKREWSLHPKSSRKSDGVAPMKNCPSCEALIYSTVMKCASCGQEFEKEAQPLMVSQEFVLIEKPKFVPENLKGKSWGSMTVTELEELRESMQYKQGWITRLLKVRGLKALQEYARVKGYHPNWAYRAYNS